MIGPEGMEKFCEDIGVEPENVSGESLTPIIQMAYVNTSS